MNLIRQEGSNFYYAFPAETPKLGRWVDGRWEEAIWDPSTKTWVFPS